MRRLSCLLALWGLLLAPPIIAPAEAAEPLRVEVGKSRLLHLKQDPAVVMIGDPSVADVVIEEGRRMFLLGMQPGETNLHILNADGAKQSQILDAEGRRQSQILEAEGEREASILRAEGQAKAVEITFRAIHEGRPSGELLNYLYLTETLPNIAEGEASKVWIVPSSVIDAARRLGDAADGLAGGRPG